jgi:Reverse transcriptase (RNA-dependent DNA polymerase)
MTPQNTIERHKARLIVKDYQQKSRINYDEVFTPVAQMEIIRLLILHAVQNKWSVHQIDIKFNVLELCTQRGVY